MITQAQLKKLLHYNPETGVFTWLKTCKGRRLNRIAGTVDKYGYVCITINGSIRGAHRLAWLYMTGEWPKNEVDHINHIKSDNRRDNLREVTHQENHKNVSLRKNNNSGVVGVFWNASRDKWGANITINNKSIYLGLYTDKFEAICARKSTERKYGFHENHGR